MLGQLGIILVGFADNMMVGHHSTDELAAASFVNNFMNLAFIMGVGFSYGLTPLAASSASSKDGNLRSLLTNSLLANSILGFFLTVAMGLFLYKIEWLNQPVELLPLIRPYFFIQVCSIPILMLFNGYKQYIEGIGRPMVAMYIMLLSNVLNVLGNWVLIFGKLGFPEMGLIGAGVSTFLSRLFSLIGLSYVTYRGKRLLHTPHKPKKLRERINKKDLKTLFQLGIPTSIQMGMEATSFSLAVIMVGWLGTNQLAAHQIISTISTLGFMQYYGLAAAVTIRIGKYYDKKDVTSIKSVVKGGRNILLLMAIITSLFILIFRNQIGYLFTKESEIIHLVGLLAFPVAIFQFGDLTQILYANTLRGLRDVKFMAISAAFCHIILALSLVYFFGFTLNLGVVGVWFAFPISLTTLGVLLLCRYKKVVRMMEIK